MRPRMNIRTRFMSFVRKSPGCWKWTGRLNSVGYGQLVVRGVTRLAHRMMWTLVMGKIPDGKNVLHNCPKRNCVNPGHLEIGSPSKRMKDCYIRGGRPRPVGELGTAHKLTWIQARLIRTLVRKGAKQIDMARRYGVSGPTIWELIHNHTWKENT